jgi:beta-glucosidase
VESQLQTAKRLTAQLTLEEKVLVLTGQDFWNTWGLDSIKLRSMLASDGPSGVRGEFWDERDNSLNLPSATAISSSWDVELLEELGSVLADEALRKGVDVVLGPTINLHRSPFGGRHFECFSEDPVLTGALATAYVRGLQKKGIAACPKHFIANDFETNRFTVNVKVAEKTLRELYMRPFEDAVVKGGAWTIMSSYNSINGTTGSENALLATPLKTEWGFDGVVISDWTAVRSLESAKAEQDLVMPGPDGPWGNALVTAVRDSVIDEATIDRKVVRLLQLAMRVGALNADGTEPLKKTRSDMTVPAAGKSFARKAEASGVVLLENQNLLPLKLDELGKVALIGHNAKAARTQGGGSATVIPDSVVTPFDALSELLGDRMTYEIGAIVQNDIEPLEADRIINPITGTPGVRIELLGENQETIYAEDRLATHITWIGSGAPIPQAQWLRLRTTYVHAVSESRLFGYASMQPTVFRVNGEVHMDTTLPPMSKDPFTAIMDPPLGSAPYQFIAGEEVRVDVLVDLRGRSGIGLSALVYAFGFAPDDSPGEELLARAVESAKDADLAIVVVGTNAKVESEGYDRKSLSLPGDQVQLVEEVLKVNKNTLVIVNSGSPVLMPWAHKVKGLMVAYFGGQEMGNALVDVLTGISEPGGRLPTTWASSEADLPVSNCTPDDNNELEYAEGIHIGYRAWSRAGVKPMYPFGYGLGYTNWKLEKVSVPPLVTQGEGIEIQIQVTNDGERHGAQVVQVYATRRSTEIDRPSIWLAGFAKVHAMSGETITCTVKIDPREFAHWDNGWKYEPGEYELHVGFSSEELIRRATITML